MADPLDVSPENLTFSLSDEARRVILDLVLQWARYDALVSQWLLLAFGLSFDSGSILLGNMDTRTKMERLKGLYQHHGKASAVRKIANLQKAHAGLVDIRNLIAHSGCAGHVKSDPRFVAFAPVRTVKGSLDTMVIEAVPVWKMEVAERFAREMSIKLYLFIQQLDFPRAAPPPEPPEFLAETDPSPRKNAGKKRQQPRPKRGR